MSVINNEKCHEALMQFREVHEKLNALIELHPDPNDRDDQVNEMIRFAESRHRILKNKVGSYLLKISNFWKNNRPEYRDYYGSRGLDMISLANDYMSRNILKYNPATENPFNYFSMVCKSAFHQIKEKYDNEDVWIVSLSHIEHCSDDIDISDPEIEFVKRTTLAKEINERNEYESYKQSILDEINTGVDNEYCIGS